MINVAIIGASGYTGGELLRFLKNHKEVNISAATSRQYNGINVSKVHPHLRGEDIKFKDIAPENIDADLVFTATPHGASMDIVPDLIERGIKVVDLSGDYRFDDVSVYEKWYGLDHSAPLEAVYGLPEIYREEIKKSNLVANPGCFPTGAILATVPLVDKNIADHVIVDSKTGVSGAGIKPTDVTHFPNCSDNVLAYAVTTHRHMPEIQQEVSKFGDAKVSFTPHLVPVIRGILTTVHTFLNEGIDSEQIKKAYIEFYEDEPFVRVLDLDEMPRLSAVRGSNYCDIGCFQIDPNGRIVVISAIDNLVKGASGQAVHNMNIMFGFDEKESIDICGLHP
ncbi:N-acetyl-gamma-glutamyl-phosphate reductase [Methanobacterium sp. ACI-7]|uniref:N-acetyl-gamma-glutamyl-phosphate reductase n=1 Tax=unclassified Methanobacterium TaxID=2627676 RepID=UPI0039C35CDF